VLTGKIKEDENTSADERDLASIIIWITGQPKAIKNACKK
jgi:hypothetical protein